MNTRASSGLSWIVLAALLWGSIGVVTSGIYQQAQTNALSIAFFRLAIAAPCLLLMSFTAYRAAAFRIDRRSLLTMLLLGCITGLYQSAYVASVPLVGVTISTLLSICTAPVIVTVVSVLRGWERLQRGTLLALGGALLGTLLVVGVNPDVAGTNPAAGVILALVAGVGYATAILIGRSLARRYHPLQVTSINFSAGAILLLGITRVTQTLVLDYPAPAWGLLLFLGVVPTALAYSLFLTGARSTPASVASIAALIDPVTAAVLAALLFGESLSVAGWVGAGLLLLSIGLLARR
jgi:DME family drug/metabolite transporter